MNRKSFLNKTVAALLTGIPFFSIMSCSGSDDDDDTNPDDKGNDSTPDCAANGTNSTILGNHGHTLTAGDFD